MAGRAAPSRRDVSAERRTPQGRTRAHGSSAAGVSVGFLRQVEHRLVDASLDQLRGIVEPLGTEPFHLLADDTPRCRVQFPHRSVGLGDKRASALVVVSPPDS